MGGLQDVERYIQNFIEKDRLGTLMGALFVSLTPELCIYEYEATPKHFNPNGMLHGGALFTVMDTSQGMLMHLALDPQYRAAATGTATIKYLSPVYSGVIQIRTVITKREGRKYFVHSEAVHKDGKILATLEEIWIAIKEA